MLHGLPHKIGDIDQNFKILGAELAGGVLRVQMDHAERLTGGTDQRRT